MKRPQELAEEEYDLKTIVKLTDAFEGLASIRIARIKNQVLQSEQFFNEIWHIYRQIRVDHLFRFGRQRPDYIPDKELYIAITAEGGFSGDIDARLIQTMLSTYDPARHDLIVIGRHGALQLVQAGVAYKKYFRLPERDTNINVQPLIKEIRQYRKTFIYYQQYLSLMSQVIKRIELSEAILDRGNEASGNEASEEASEAAPEGVSDKVARKAAKVTKKDAHKNLSDSPRKRVVANDEIISERTYIFEPDPMAVASHLERSMLDIMLSQVLLDSKLAQYASRFRAMRVANERSSKSLKDVHIAYSRAKRSQADERLKEIMNGLKKMRTGVGV